MSSEENPWALYAPETTAETFRQRKATHAISLAVEAAGDAVFAAGNDFDSAHEKYVMPVLAKFKKFGATDSGTRERTEKAVVMRAVETASRAWSKASTRVRQCKKPETLKKAQEESARLEAVYRELSHKRDVYFGHAPSVGICPSCGKKRPDPVDGGFKPGSVCPECGHVEPSDEKSEEKPKARIAIVLDVEGVSEADAISRINEILDGGSVQSAIHEGAEGTDDEDLKITSASVEPVEEKVVYVALTKAKLSLLIDGLDSHRYWNISDEKYRNDGFVHEPGSDDPEKVEEIKEVDALEAELEGVQREAFGS